MPGLLYQLSKVLEGFDSSADTETTIAHRYVKDSKVLFKVAGFADAQRRREAAAAGGACHCLLVDTCAWYQMSAMSAAVGHPLKTSSADEQLGDTQTSAFHILKCC